jgi:hypothetical protein
MLARSGVPDVIRSIIVGHKNYPGNKDQAPVDNNLKAYSRSLGGTVEDMLRVAIVQVHMFVNI